MQSSIIGKIEKAKRYAQEKERISFSDFSAHFQGEHDVYSIGYRAGSWSCSCHFFSQWKTCSHTMAMERILEGMLPQESPAKPVILRSEATKNLRDPSSR